MSTTTEPIPMRLPCPACGALHIDGLSVDGTDWSKKPHATHACQFCGMVWRPAVVMTVGVRFLPGFRNAVATEPPREPRAMTREEGERTGLWTPAPGLLDRARAALVARLGPPAAGCLCLSESACGRLELEVRGLGATTVYRGNTPDELVSKIAAGECEDDS